MSEFWELLAVLAALYGWECLHWASGDSLVVSRNHRSGRIVTARRVLGDLRPALFLPDPWPWTEVFTGGASDLGAASFDLTEARVTVARVRAATRGLKVAASTLGLMVFGAGPMLAVALGLERAWRPWLASVLLATAVVMVLFHRRYRRLCPEADDRVQTQLVMLLLPLAAMRAVATLTVRTMASFQPLVVAMALCPPERWRPLARKALFDQPRLAHGGALSSALERLLIAAETSPSDLLAPPSHRESTARTYCPRCYAQYRLTIGCCAECGGIPLAPFPDSGLAANAPPIL